METTTADACSSALISHGGQLWHTLPNDARSGPSSHVGSVDWCSSCICSCRYKSLVFPSSTLQHNTLNAKGSLSASIIIPSLLFESGFLPLPETPTTIGPSLNFGHCPSAPFLPGELLCYLPSPALSFHQTSYNGRNSYSFI